MRHATDFPIMCSRGVRVEHATFIIDVSSIEQLVVAVSWPATICHVASHGIKVAYSLGEGDV